MKYLRACLDPRVVGAAAMAGIAVVIVAPGSIAALLPLLLVAACPLSMLLMMRMMGGHASESGSPPSGHSVADLQSELAALTERQRRVESELAAATRSRGRDAARALEPEPARDP